MEITVIILLGLLVLAARSIGHQLRRIANVNSAWWLANYADDASTTTTDDSVQQPVAP